MIGDGQLQVACWLVARIVAKTVRQLSGIENTNYDPVPPSAFCWRAVNDEDGHYAYAIAT